MRARIAIVGAIAVVVLAVIAAAAPAAAALIGSVLILSSIAIFGWAIIGLAVPHKVGLPTRWHSFGLCAASVTVLVIGGAVTAEPPAQTNEETGSRRVERPAPVASGTKCWRPGSATPVGR